MPALSTTSTFQASPPGQDHALPSFGRECRDTLLLALPLISGQLSQMLMGVVDTIMVGRLGVVPLGAATLSNTVLMVPFVLGLGLLSSVSVRVSQASGADRPHDAREALRHATWLALGYGLLVVLAVALGIPFLSRLGQPPEVVARVPTFLMTCALSLVPALLSMTWKSHADALNHPWPPFWIMLGGVGVNVVLNWLLIWGHCGFPALGLEGAAVATLSARILIAVVMFRWITRSERVRDWTPPQWFVRCRIGAFFHLLAIGFPASLQMLTEVCAFSAASLLIGTLGAVPLAAHQVAITCAATTFMVPLGVALAITVRVGEIVGAGERPRLRRVLLGGWLFAVGFMSLSMLAFLLFGRDIGAMFVSDAGVIDIAAKLLLVAGVFQLFDGLQVVSSCALRGVNDVRIPAWLAFFAYWIVALPCGATLGLGLHLGALGIWIGLAIGLGVAALALGSRAWRKLVPRS
jgi:MATE family multidrug resistance protein